MGLRRRMGLSSQKGWRTQGTRRAGGVVRRRRMAMGRTTVTRNEVHGGEEARRGWRKGASPFSGTISSLASTKAF